MAGLIPVGIALRAAGVAAFQGGVAVSRAAVTALGTSFNTAGAAGGGFGPRVAGATASLRELEGVARGAGDFLGDLGRIFGPVVGGAVAMATAIVAATAALASFIATAGGLASIKFAAEVERDFKFIQAVLQATDSEMKQLMGTAEQLAANIPIAFRDIGSQLRELGRAGISLDTITASAGKLTASLGILARGEASPQKIAEALASGEQAFKATGGTLDDVAKSILGVANATRLGIPEVVSAFAKAAPTAGIFKATTEELGAFIAVVGAAGIRGEEAGTGIRNFLLRLSNPSREAAEQMQKFGLSAFDAAGQVRPLRDILADLQAKYSDSAIAAAGVSQAQRAYSLSQIFATRTAAVAALAIIQGTEAYDKYLQVIRDTDPIIQAAQATDNLLDQLEILRNRASILDNVFGQGALGGLRSFVNQINDTVGDVSDPTNKLRASAGALGQGVGALFTGAGIGEAADAIEAQFGSKVADVFQQIAIEAARVRVVITGELIPAVIEFANTLARIAFGTVFNPAAIHTFGDVLRELIGIFTGVIRAAGILAEAIATLAPIAIQVGQTIGTIFSAIGTSVQTALSALADFSNIPKEIAQNFRNLANTLENSPLALSQRIPITELRFFADVLDASTTSAANLSNLGFTIGQSFEGVNVGVQKASNSLQEMVAREQEVRRLAGAIREQEQAIKELNTTQLSEEGPDVSQFIADRVQTIGALREEIRTLTGVEQADDAVSRAHAAVAEATQNLQRALEGSEGAFRNFSAEEAEARRQAEAMATAVKRVADIFEDLTRAANKNTREVGDRVDDLVTKTNASFAKLDLDTNKRLADIQRNLAQASSDAQEAFDFETTVQAQRVVVSEMFEDFSTAQGRFFDKSRRLQQDDLATRDRGRQREQQQIEQGLQRESDARTRANSEANEDFARSISQRFEDTQRALSRQQNLETEALSQTFQQQNESTSRQDEDARRQRDLNREIARAKNEEERRGIRERFAEQSSDLSQSRAQQNRDAATRRAQEEQLKQLRSKQENETLGVTRSIAQQELAIRRGLAEQERKFKLNEEFKLFFLRIALEERFIAESIRLRESADIPQQQRLENEQTSARRQVQGAERNVDQGFREQQFRRDTFLRERSATRQEIEIEEQRLVREEELRQDFFATLAQIDREATQKMQDQLLTLLNTADEIERRVGRNFPELDVLRAQGRGIINTALGAQQALIQTAPGRLVAPNIGRTVGEVGIGGALGFEFTKLGSSLGTLQGAVNLLTGELQRQTQVGRTNLTIDDFNVNNSIVVGDGALNRLGGLVGTAIAEVVRQK